MNKILWVDLETTGLDPKKDLVLEIAAIITDEYGRYQAKFERVIHHSMSDIYDVSPNTAVSEMHSANGLWDGVAKSASRLHHVQTAFANFLFEEKPESLRLGGNGPHFDFDFLSRDFPAVLPYLHYRRVDTSCMHQVLCLSGKQLDVPHIEHRAHSDIEHSIAIYKHQVRLNNR